MPSSPVADRRRASARIASAAAVMRLAVLFLVLAAAKRMVPVKTLAAWASRPARSRRTAPPALIIGRVLRAGAIVGTPDRDCLQRSLLLYRELRRAGTPAMLVVGMRRAGDVLSGHAWVRIGDEVIVESVSEVGAFEPILTFPGGGKEAGGAPAQLHA